MTAKRILQFSGLLALLAFLVWKGILPALTEINTDFPNYYTASRMILERVPFERIYDDPWFQEQIHRYGIIQQGRFSPFPPLTAFVMLPFASFDALLALRIWTCVNLVVLVACISLVCKLSGKDWLWSSIVILASGIGLANNFRFGQFYLVLTLLILLGFVAWRPDQNGISGALLGIGAAVKYFPILFIGLAAFRKEWNVVIIGVATLTVLYMMSIITLGIEVHIQFFTTVLGDHLAGNIQNPFSSTFQSWQSLLRRIFVWDTELNPRPVFASNLGFYVVLCLVLGAIVHSACKAVKSAKDLRLQFAIVTTGGFVLLPASATYHFLLLSVPVAIVLSLAENAWGWKQRMLALSYWAIGFIPYGIFRGFDSSSSLAVLCAYPRLYLVSAVYLLTLLIARDVSKLRSGATPS